MLCAERQSGVCVRRFRSFARMSIELGQRPAPPASAAVKNSSLFAGSATPIAPITEAADEGRQRSTDRASSMAEGDDEGEGEEEGLTVSLDDDESDPVAEMAKMNPQRRLSSVRRRRSGAHFTLLPEKAQWIDLVRIHLPSPPFLDPARTLLPRPRCNPSSFSGRHSLVEFRTQRCAITPSHTRFPFLTKNGPGVVGAAGAQGDVRD